MQHEFFAQEKAHLAQTHESLRRETAYIDEQVAQLAELLPQLRMRAGGTYSEELVVKENIFRRLKRMQGEMRLSAEQAYFTRVDFTPRMGKSGSYYLGKHGLMDSRTLDVIIADWRSPIANLYYSGQIGPTHYEAPDGIIDGELTLKRQFSIKNAELKSVTDADLVTQDELLYEVLESMTGERLTEVVSTIQAEQNIVIRHPIDSPLVVQGAAGSGKTTIALHRIAYLLYAHGDYLFPENLMIVAPSPLFLNYIRDVLPDLGVDNAFQQTFEGLCQRLMDKNMPRVLPDTHLETALTSDTAYKDIMTVCRFKGSDAFADMLSSYLDNIEESALPEGEVRYGTVMLYPKGALRHTFLHDMPFSLSIRKREMVKNLRVRMKSTVARVSEALYEQSDRKADEIRISERDPQKAKQRLTALYQTRDKRIEEAKKRAPEFIKKFDALFPKWEACAIYQSFMQSLLTGEDEQARLAAEHTLTYIGKKRVQAEDLPAMLMIEMRINGFGDRVMPILHTIVDEAQDLSPLHVRVLRSLFPNSGFTMVGDLMQGIHAYRSFSDWDEALAALPKGAQLKHLTNSYRSTVEVMQLANAVAARYPFKGQSETRPVPRHGPMPSLYCCKDDAQRKALLVRLIKGIDEAQLKSAAIITRTRSAALNLYNALKDDADVALIDTEAMQYSARTWVASVSDVKGLEFDSVIIADADQSVYQRPLDARLLYVALTRSFGRLALIYKDAPAFSLLEGECPSDME